MLENTFSIGAAAEASGLNAKTIRYYEQIGLIPPARRGNEAARTGGNRVFSEADVDRLRFIRNARLLGLGLDDVRDLLTGANGGCPGKQRLYHETLIEHLRAIDDRIEHLLALRSAVERLMSRERPGSRGAGMRAGCGCMDAPELSSGTATAIIEPMNGSISSGRRNGKGAA
jgi:MerR family copper efflux transcriptional regulator